MGYILTEQCKYSSTSYNAWKKLPRGSESWARKVLSRSFLGVLADDNRKLISYMNSRDDSQLYTFRAQHHIPISRTTRRSVHSTTCHA